MMRATDYTVDFSQVEKLAINRYKKYEISVQYGTAGFRTRADNLEHVLFRMGLLSVLRSQIKKAAIGLMITASHNPEEDNGVKIVDPSGEMLESSWEIIATKLANVSDDKVASSLQQIVKEHDIDTAFPASVIVGRDTRNSSLMLSQAAINGIKIMNGNVNDVGVVTTPQLHYLLVCTNTNGTYGSPTLDGYYEKLSRAFKGAVGSMKDNNKYKANLQLDAANGVGSIAIKEFQKRLNDVLSIEVYNSGEGQLNHRCGADYVKVQQEPPTGIPLTPFTRCVSIDGDADRVVYFYVDEKERFHLLDGDKIAVLVAMYFKELLQLSNLNLKLSIVQTAYANGNSTEFITKTMKIPTTCVPTGVKHLHHEALKHDIGIYFEANGHGTVVFSNTAVKIIKSSVDDKSKHKDEQEASATLSHMIDLINQTVGDAISDMLLVEVILRAKGWDLSEWQGVYTDLPNKQIKVKVKDRNTITTTDAERRCLTPANLQPRIDSIVREFSRGRSFVRPSGTEDIVRVYAECEKASEVDILAAKIALAVYELAGGIGPKPLVQ